MKQRRVIIYFFIFLAFGLTAQGQLFNLAFRSNNQQILEEAIKGSFIKVIQSYELCDTSSNERFGREGNSYFNRIPFLGIETSKGLILPKSIINPWEVDEDFKKYEQQYKPLLTETSFLALKVMAPSCENVPQLLNTENTKPCNGFVCYNDSSIKNIGLEIDSLPGPKTGWLIWVTAPKDFAQTDSIKLISVRKDLDALENSEPIKIETPNVEDLILGGIYVLPIQTKIGQLNIYLSGIISFNNNEWGLSFPFIHKTQKEESPLSPVKVREGLNQLKPKKIPRNEERK